MSLKNLPEHTLQHLSAAIAKELERRQRQALAIRQIIILCQEHQLNPANIHVSDKPLRKALPDIDEPVSQQVFIDAMSHYWQTQHCRY